MMMNKMNKIKLISNKKINKIMKILSMWKIHREMHQIFLRVDKLFLIF